MAGQISSLLLLDKGVLNRQIFSDPTVYQQELEQIFGRCWLFIGHESQIQAPHDFAASYMGEDPVLLTRDGRGKLHAFLNMCRHRGNRICRTDKGNAPSFMCTYHGWTFGTDGKLVGVPGYKEAYFEELDRSQWGLVEAGHIESYKGLVFATWDEEAPTLSEYLGDMAWYLDVWADRVDGGIELLGGVHKWTIAANWKFYAENIGGDGYHFPITHSSAMQARITGQRGPNPYQYPDGPRYCFDAGNGHEIVAMGHSVREALGGQHEKVKDYFMATLPEMEGRLGSLRAREVTGIGNVFPNMAYVSSNFTIKVMHPRGPLRTEAWNYCFVDRKAPQEAKDAMRRHLTRTQGPSGLIEEDDMGNLIQCTAAARMPTGRKIPVNYLLGLGHEGINENYPGKISPSPSEANQRAMYRRWAEIMDAPSWKDISLTSKNK